MQDIIKVNFFGRGEGILGGVKAIGLQNRKSVQLIDVLSARCGMIPKVQRKLVADADGIGSKNETGILFMWDTSVRI